MCILINEISMFSYFDTTLAMILYFTYINICECCQDNVMFSIQIYGTINSKTHLLCSNIYIISRNCTIIFHVFYDRNNYQNIHIAYLSPFHNFHNLNKTCITAQFLCMKMSVYSCTHYKLLYSIHIHE